VAPSLPPHEVLPFPPGESPFHIKGVAYRGHIDYIEERLPGGARAVQQAFVSQALRDFFDQRFLASTWYDVFPLIAAATPCARLAELEVDAFLRVRSRYQVEQDVRGVYALMLKLASAEAVAKRLPRLASQYFDFGENEVAVVDPGRIRATRRGVPILVAEWYAPIFETYIEYALKVNGARNPRVSVGAPRREGTAHGIETTSTTVEIRWD
jgi:hypothetical protein